MNGTPVDIYGRILPMVSRRNPPACLILKLTALLSGNKMNNDELFTEADRLHDIGEYEKAFELFVKAAENGDAASMARIACMYTSGEGVELDYDKAIEWEMKAIEAGYTTAMLNIGITYRMKGDLRQSKHWFEKSLAAGDGAASLQLAKLYIVSDKETERVRGYLQQAIDSDNMIESDVEEARALLAELD